jgi:hypothetical protein
MYGKRLTFPDAPIILYLSPNSSGSQGCPCCRGVGAGVVVGARVVGCGVGFAVTRYTFLELTNWKKAESVMTAWRCCRCLGMQLQPVIDINACITSSAKVAVERF